MENAFFEIKKDLVFKSLTSEALYKLAYSKHLVIHINSPRKRNTDIKAQHLFIKDNYVAHLLTQKMKRAKILKYDVFIKV